MIVYLLINNKKFIVFEETVPTVWMLKDEDDFMQEYNCIEFSTQDQNDYTIDVPKRKSRNSW